MESSGIDTIGLLGVLIALITLLVTLMKEWSHISEFFQSLKVKLPDRPRVNISRRNVIKAFGAIGVISSCGLIFHTWLRNLQSCRPVSNANFVLNEKNGIVHHSSICKEHLPSARNACGITSPTVTNSLKVHSGKLVHIAGSKAIKLPDEVRESLLLEAIRQSPTSVHLYSQLIKIWGRRKQYHRIHEFLAANVDYIGGLMRKPNNSPKKEKLYRKTYDDLIQRQNKALRLARIAKLESS